MRYLTPYSFAKYNSDWTIKIYSPLAPGKEPTWTNTTENKAELDVECYFNRLKDISNVEMIEIDFKNDTNDVFRSDKLRLELLSTEGGLWSDFDILYFKPITQMCVIDASTQMCVIDASTYMSYNKWSRDPNDWYHSIGFLLASANNKTFKKLKDKVDEYFDETNYQCIGSHMYNKELQEGEFFNIPFETVYPVPWNAVVKFYTSQMRFKLGTIGIHWFAGSSFSHSVEEILTEDTIDEYMYPDATFIKIVKKVCSQ